ncbi:MAG: adenosylcobinamide-GDP ribazoletransferase [Rhizobiaceae bacterium]|nr:adenosylcobinamide-GDP ribazoletransferase [Rhizobiaceae bacterium]
MIHRLFADTRSSILFLSRLPVSYSAQTSRPDFSYSARCFAFAGLVIAIPAALILWITFNTGLPAPAVAILAVATMIIVTGALHEDGLADTADGFWGGHSKQRKLEIMRDSAIGTYGVLGLTVTIFLRVAFYTYLIESLGGAAAAIVLMANASLSRAAMLQPWMRLPPARPGPDADEHSNPSGGQKPASGLSARYGMPTSATMTWGTLAALPAVFMLIWNCGAVSALSALVGLQFCVLIMTRLSKTHIEGHSGDTLGATQQLSELGLLLGLVWTM